MILGSRVLAVIGIASTFAVSVLAVPGSATTFRGTLVLREPVQLSGGLEMEVSDLAASVVLPASMKPTDLLQSPHAVVKIWEYNLVETSIIRPGDLPTHVVPPQVPSEKFDSTNLRIVSLQTGPDANILASDLGGNQSTPGLEAFCELSPTGGVEAFEIGDPGRATRHIKAPPQGVRAKCDATQVGLRGRSDVNVYGTVVQLTDDEGRDRRIETGTFVVRTLTGAVWGKQRVVRILEVESESPQSAFLYTGRATVDIVSPAIGAVGRLTFPASARGEVVWGDWTNARAPDDASPNGTFVFKSEAPSQLTVEGITSNAPPRPAPRATEPAWGPHGPSFLVVAAVAASIAGWFTFRRVFMGLFSRIVASQSLEHPTRRAVYEFVRQNPGAQVSEAAHALDARYGSVLHHAKTLHFQGQLDLRKFGSRTALFVKGAVPWSDQPAWFYARNPRARRLLEICRQDPTVTQTQLAARLGVSQPRISKMLRRLTMAGVLSR